VPKSVFRLIYLFVADARHVALSGRAETTYTKQCHSLQILDANFRHRLALL
jgi:hypothetical protein